MLHRHQAHLVLSMLAIALAVACAPAAPSPAPAGGTPAGSGKPTATEEVLTYKSADRTQLLEEGAKARGEVMLYTTNFEDTVVRPIANAFNKHYPNITIRVFRADSDAILTRLTEEYRAGRHEVDLLWLEDADLLELQNQGLLLPYFSPLASEYPAEVNPAKYHWYTQRVRISSLAYNTRLVPAQEVPRSYQDLLDPKWKGKIAVPDSSTTTRWIQALFEQMGEAQTREFLGKLKQQEVAVHKVSGKAVVELASSGQAHLVPTASLHHVEMLRTQGGPVEWTAYEPMPTSTSGVAIPRHTRAPHAALLFADFMLSKEGQQVYATTQEIPAHPQVEPVWPMKQRIAQGKLLYLDPARMVESDRTAKQLMQEIFRRG